MDTLFPSWQVGLVFLLEPDLKHVGLVEAQEWLDNKISCSVYLFYWVTFPTVNCGVLVCPQIFMQNGPLRLQTTCSHCGGSGKHVKVNMFYVSICFKMKSCVCLDSEHGKPHSFCMLAFLSEFMVIMKSCTYIKSQNILPCKVGMVCIKQEEHT